MHKFLQEQDLVQSILNVFKSAKEEIVIVSPYIKLYDKIKDALFPHLDNPNIKIKILFGKNYKWTKDDITFIKQFPNVLVKYRENLHAKYYANEISGILTSMNLYEKSIKSNYETGIEIEYETRTDWFLNKYWILKILLGLVVYPLAFITCLFTFNFDAFKKDQLVVKSKKYIDELISNSDHTIYQKETKITKKIFKTKKVPRETNIIVDVFENMCLQKNGYCIRTGKIIDFDPSHPYSKESYYDWAKEGSDRNCKENFCHMTGKQSNGKTSINNPILYSPE